MKRRILVVGGNGRRNVPPWLHAAFEVEHFESSNADWFKPDPGQVPAAVVVLTSWVSHKHFYDARTIAEKFDVPLILSPGGWSAALQYAAENGIEWFLKDIEAAKHSGGEVHPREVEEVIESAWREAYNREWAARKALEKRYAKDREKFEEAQKRIATATRREEAAQRVVTEVREAARRQREYLDAKTDEIRKIADDLKARDVRIRDHLTSLRSLLNLTDEAVKHLLNAAAQFQDNRESLARSVESLEAVLSQPITAPSVMEPAIAQ